MNDFTGLENKKDSIIIYHRLMRIGLKFRSFSIKHSIKPPRPNFWLLTFEFFNTMIISQETNSRFPPGLYYSFCPT